MAIVIVIMCAGSADVISSEYSDTSETGETTQIHRGFQGVVIDSIEFEPRNVFSERDENRSWILRTLNRVRIKTRRHILEREALLKPGDPYDSALAYETERNLRALPFIYDASVRLEPKIDSVGNAVNILHVQTIDEWSLSGGIQAKRRQGRTIIEIGAAEDNLLGYGHQIDFSYIFNDPDPNYFSAGYTNPRFADEFIEIQLEHVSNPLNKSTYISCFRPYAHRHDPYRGGVTFQHFDSRKVQLLAGDTLATYFSSGGSFDAQIGRQWGDYYTKTRLDFIYSYAEKKIDRVDRRTMDSLILPSDSALNTFTISLERARSDFIPMRRLQLQGRTEDVVVRFGAALQFGHTRTSDLSQTLYNYIAPTLILDQHKGKFVSFNRLSRESWFSEGREIRSYWNAESFFYAGIQKWLTLAGRIAYRQDNSDVEFDPISVDEDTGVRGYTPSYRTGNHSVIGNLEARFFTGVTILTTRWGFAAHLDFGDAWRNQETLRISNMLLAYGVGLRVDLAQAGSGRIARLDVSHAEDRGLWQVTVGVGQYLENFLPR